MSAKPLMLPTAFLMLILAILLGVMYWCADRLHDHHLASRSQSPAPRPLEVPELWSATRKSSPEVISFGHGAVESVSNRLRVCTYNIENFSDGIGDGGSRTEEAAARQAAGAAALVDEIDPDVLLVQEIENTAAAVLLNRQLMRPFPMGYVTDFRRQNDVEKLNLAVLSRVPLDHVLALDFSSLPSTDRPPRGVLRFSLELEAGRRLLVYNLHLKSNWGKASANIRKRERAMQVVADDVRHLLETEDDVSWEVVVLGDMNTDPELPRHRFEKTLGLLDGFTDVWAESGVAEQTTVPTRHGDAYREFPPATFDRILVDPGLREAPWVAGAPAAVARGVYTNDVNVVAGEQVDHVSDHYPVYIELLR